MTEKNEPPTLPTQEEFTSMVTAANAGDRSAIELLRKTLDAQPQIWQAVSDLASHAQLATIAVISKGNKLMEESLMRKMAEMRQELGGSDPSPLTAMAVDRVIAAWMEVQLADTLHADPGAAALPQGRFLLNWRAAASRRFDSAMKSLILAKKTAEFTETIGRPAANKAGKRALKVFPRKTA